MASTYRDALAVCAIALACLASVSRSSPLTCKDLIQPLDEANPRDYEGSWALVADSLKVIKAEAPVETCESVRINFSNSMITKANLCGNQCQYLSRNITVDGPHFSFSYGPLLNFSGTVFKTSCADCMLLTFRVDTPKEKTEELCLFSRRRAEDQKNLEEFKAQVKCLEMPEHVVMDPTKELCSMNPDHV
ncbi:hypothetical protein GBF38_003559 [Nibea albiflora]|uniref:Uncharacterized protein n=1 Tax=Nibea albiflora TaxID=240163 RepID=A0ACB7FL30_NIBAL|nr:hypothetical protein GBF38_003559 [Nibea albiflora]